MVETAITLPAVILFTMLVVQWALLWHGRHVAESAVQDGVRAARGYQATAADGQRSAQAYLQAVAPALLTAPRVEVSRTATMVTVRIQANVLAVIPGGSFQVTESATAPVERWS
ncbi:MAG: pilus assembly protein [Kineosporiaceae bacterium]|nr:pilus assembly protein [Kineosporiaceae bacterium]